MATGPGKYDTAATQVRQMTQALAVVVMVLHGRDGSGFSVQAHESIGPDRLADMLEMVAREIRATPGDANAGDAA